MNQPQHRHEWVETTEIQDPTRTWACTECQATARSCVLCERVIETHGRTCEHCVSDIRNLVREVRDLYRQLPDVIAQVAGLHAIRYDRAGGSKTRRTTDTALLGGAAFVMAAPGAERTSLSHTEGTTLDRALLEAEKLDPPSVLTVLTLWEDAWRTQQHQAAAPTTSVKAATEYLVLHTTWAAQHAVGWLDYVADLRGLRARMRVLTGQHQPPVEAGVPCPYCAGRIVQHWSKDGLTDTRRCDRCGLSWASEAHFMLAIREAHRSLPQTHPDQLVTIDDAKRIYRGRVRPNLLDLWVHRGILTERGRNERGATLYRLGDIDERLTGVGESAS